MNKEFTLKGTPDKTIYDFGFLKIKNPNISISNQKGLGVEATVNILENEAKLAIITYIPNKIIAYQITPILKSGENIKFPITPWTDIDIKNFTFFIKPEHFKLQTNIKIFGQDTELNFSKSRTIEIPKPEKVSSDNYAEIIIKQLKPSDIIKSAEKTNFDSIKLTNATFKIDDPFTKGKDHAVTIKCSANLQDLNLGLPDLSNVYAEINLNKTTGFSLETILNDLNLSDDIKIKNAILKVVIPPSVKSPTNSQIPPQTNTQNQNLPNPTEANTPETTEIPKIVTKPSVFLSGMTDLNLPLIGNLKTDIFAEYDKGIFNFKVKIDKEIKFEDIATFKNATLSLSSNGNFEIIGETNILNTDWIGTLKFSKTIPKQEITPKTQQEKTIQPDTKQQGASASPEMQTEQSQTNSQQEPATQQKYFKVGPYYVEFSATAKTKIKPFSNISELNKIKQIADISIENPMLGVRPDKTFYIFGKTNILNFESNISVEMKSPKELTLKATPPANWQLSNSIESFKNTFFDSIDLSDITIAISSYQHFDANLNLNLNKGFNLVANAQLSGETFKGAKVLAKNLEQKLRLAGTFGESLTETYFSIAIPIPEIKLTEKAILKNINFVLVGSGPAFGFKSQILITPSNLDQPLLFTGEIAIKSVPPSGVLKATMQGIWENPLGINGLSIQDLAAQIAITLTPPTPVPDVIGLTGKFILSPNKKIEVATNYSTAGDIVLMGIYTGDIFLEDLFSIPAKLNPSFDIKSFKNKFPDIGFRDTSFKIAPLPTKIGEIEIEQGLSFKGEMFFLNDKKAFINSSIGSNGIIAQGFMPKFKLGPIEVDGTGLDGEYGTKDDGPTLDFQLTPEIQHLLISGLIDIKLAKGQADILVGTDGIKIFLLGSLFNNLFKVSYELQSVGSINDLNNIDLTFKAELSNDINEYLSEKITKGLSIINKKSTESIKKALKKLDAIDEKIDSIENQINELNKEIDNLNNEKKRIEQAKDDYNI